MQEYLDDKEESITEKLTVLSIREFARMCETAAREISKSSVHWYLFPEKDEGKENGPTDKDRGGKDAPEPEPMREVYDGYIKTGATVDEVRNAEFLGYDDFVRNVAPSYGISVTAERDGDSSLWNVTVSADSKDRLYAALRAGEERYRLPEISRGGPDKGGKGILPDRPKGPLLPGGGGEEIPEIGKTVRGGRER